MSVNNQIYIKQSVLDTVGDVAAIKVKLVESLGAYMYRAGLIKVVEKPNKCGGITYRAEVHAITESNMLSVCSLLGDIEDLLSKYDTFNTLGLTPCIKPIINEIRSKLNLDVPK